MDDGCERVLKSSCCFLVSSCKGTFPLIPSFPDFSIPRRISSSSRSFNIQFIFASCWMRLWASSSDSFFDWPTPGARSAFDFCFRQFLPFILRVLPTLLFILGTLWLLCCNFLPCFFLPIGPPLPRPDVLAF